MEILGVSGSLPDGNQHVFEKLRRERATKVMPMMPFDAPSHSNPDRELQWKFIDIPSGDSGFRTTEPRKTTLQRQPTITSPQSMTAYRRMTPRSLIAANARFQRSGVKVRRNGPGMSPD